MLGTLLASASISNRLTRESETAMSLGARTECANDWGADYFVSVHCNSDGPDAKGIETLYKTERGKELATPVQAALIKATKEVDRGLKHRTNLYVLNGTLMPSILVEIGFISHPQTEVKLVDTDYQLLVARAIAEGILKYLAKEPPLA